MRAKFKLPSSIIPRDYQVSFLNQARNLTQTQPDTWHLFRAPTGTGKSVAIFLFLENVPDSICITPRIEIIAGMMEKLGHCIHDMSDTELITLSWKYRIITPIRLRNILAKGLLEFMPSTLIIDEAHHDLASTYQDITMYLNGCPKVGLTATPYRGTPKGTQEYLKQWGNKVHTLLDLPTAIANNYCSLPEVDVWPLLDDDTIDVQNGEFKWNQSQKASDNITDAIQHLAAGCKQFYCQKSRLWDMPTMFAVPTTVAAKLLHQALIKSNLPASIVTQETSRKERTKAFDSCVRGSTGLVQISVVSEGVDLPIRRLIDLSPTMSPVKWLQQIGRIMRPNGEPEYICCCRNLERHCYLMEGLLPNSSVKEAQEAFGEEGKPLVSKRSGTRVVGLEGLGRFTTTPIFLMDGTVGFLYNLVHTAGFKRTEYMAFIHPNSPDPVKGMKVSTNDGTEMKWGRWKLVDALPDLKGCISAKVNPLTPKQQARWDESAAEHGLNPHRTITSREFQILPFLMNTGLKFRT